MKKETRRRFLPAHDARNRPNKTAQGMTATARRSGHSLKGDILTLAVRGTLDTLQRYKFGEYSRSRRPCPCCGSTSAGKIALKKNIGG